MDGLSSIRPEIQAFVSRENRSHADPWLQQVDWVERERTLTLYVQRPATALSQSNKGACPEPASWDKEELLATLTRPSLLKIYFPASLDEQPFCFCEEDSLVPATEAANKRLRPLSCNSVLAVVTTAVQCVKRESPSVQAHSDPTGDPLGERAAGEARARMAAEAVLAAIKEDPLGADLVLAFLSMAVSSYRRDTVSTPFPKQLESSGLQRAYSASVSCLEDIPSMLEMSRWTDAGQLLQQLPPVAVLVLHFVLVSLPAKLRTPSKNNAKNASAAAPVSGSRHTAEGGRPSVTTPDGSTATLAAAAASAMTSASKGGRDSVAGADGGGVGGVVGTQLGDVPSHVFEALLPSDPAFDAEVERGGSKIAYHGSSPENFHSILNTGLRVMSGSRLMKNGAAFGEGIYLSGSRKTAATFASRGDGSGTTVWPRSIFGDTSPVAAAAKGDAAAPPVDSRHKKFRYRLVAKCRVLKGDGVKELEGSGDDASYFVVSDKSRVRVEALLLFHESQAPGQLAASATQPNAGAIGRALARVSSSSGISCEGTGGGTVDGNPSGKRERNSDGGDAGGVVRRIRNWMGEGVLEVSSPWGVFASLGVGVVSTAIAFAVGLCLPLFLGSSHGRQQ